jgi:2'-5' RNA ligase
MPFGVILYFDDQTETSILNVWKSLAENRLTSSMLTEGIRPHITLAIFDDLDCRPCENELKKITSKTASPLIQFTHLGLFTYPEPVIFAAPLVTKALLDFHYELHEKLTVDGKDPWELYLPGRWVPHCSLALGYKAEKQSEIFQFCQVLPLPMHVQAVQLGVVSFKPVKDLFNFDFLRFED